MMMKLALLVAPGLLLLGACTSFPIVTSTAIATDHVSGSARIARGIGYALPMTDVTVTIRETHRRYAPATVATNELHVERSSTVNVLDSSDGTPSERGAHTLDVQRSTGGTQPEGARIMTQTVTLSSNGERTAARDGTADARALAEEFDRIVRGSDLFEVHGQRLNCAPKAGGQAGAHPGENEVQGRGLKCEAKASRTDPAVVLAQGALGTETRIGPPKVEVETRIVPDPDAQFQLGYRERGSSADDIVIRVGPNGLLQEIDVTTTDRSGDVIVELARSTGLSRTPGLPGSDAGGESRVPTQERVLTFGLVAGKRDAASASACFPGDTPTCFRAELVPAEIEGSGTEPASPEPASPEAESGGVFFRPLASFELRVCERKLDDDACPEDGILLLRQRLQAPDPKRLAALDLRGYSFVKTVHSIDFTDGVPTSATVSRPSSALGLVKVLPAAFGAFFEGLASGFESQESAAKNEAAALAQSKAVVEAREALERSTIKLVEARRALDQALAEETDGGNDASAPGTAGDGSFDAPGAAP
jgi:hypothetical protein